MLEQLKLEDCIGHPLLNAVHQEDDEYLLLIFPHGYCALRAYAHGQVECEHMEEMSQDQVLYHFPNDVLIETGFIGENELRQIRDAKERQAEEQQRQREYDQYLRLKYKFEVSEARSETK